MSILIDRVIDVTSRVIRIGRNESSTGSIEGILAPSKNYQLADNDGFFNFLSGGLFFRNQWRGVDIDDTGKDGRDIFKSLIGNISLGKTDLGFVTDVQGKSAVTTLLEWPVESNTKDETFEVSGAHAAGPTANTVTIKTGTTIIPVLSQVSFTDSLVPRYQVIAQTDDGSKTTSITLDRGLERALANDDAVLITTPAVKTGAQEIFDNFVTLNNEATVTLQLGETFNQISAADSAAGNFIWVHVRREDNVKLRDHLALVLEMCDLGLSINDAGVIDIYRGNDYKGEKILDRITSAEIQVPFQFAHDDSKLVAGYDALYMDSSEQVVKVASGDVGQELINEYKARARWVPVPSSGNSANPFDYTVLYSDATTADFYGERRLAYYGYPRIKLTAPVKRSLHDRPLKRVTPQLGKQYLVSTKISKTLKLIDEPVRVTGFNYSEDRLNFASIEFELSNRPTPNLIVDRVALGVPPFVSIESIRHGFSATFDPLTDALLVEIYLVDQAFRILQEIPLVPATVMGQDIVTYCHPLLLNGECYYARFFYVRDNVFGPKTDFIKFKPVIDLWVTESGDQVVTELGEEISL